MEWKHSFMFQNILNHGVVGERKISAISTELLLAWKKLH